MLEPEQIMHALMILEVESTGELDDSVMVQVSAQLGCDDEDMAAIADMDRGEAIAWPMGDPIKVPKGVPSQNN